MNSKKKTDKPCCCEKNLEIQDYKESIVALGTANAMNLQVGGDAFLDQIEAVTAVQSNCSCCNGDCDKEQD